MMAKARLTQADYTDLAEFRFLLRTFLDFSEKAARGAGLTPRQHQALLVLKGLGAGRPIAVGLLAERLRIRHHSAVELANRLVAAGLVERQSDENDNRRVLLALTPAAEAHLETLSAAHLDELRRIEPVLAGILARRSGKRR